MMCMCLVASLGAPLCGVSPGKSSSHLFLVMFILHKLAFYNAQLSIHIYLMQFILINSLNVTFCAKLLLNIL